MIPSHKRRDLLPENEWLAARARKEERAIIAGKKFSNRYTGRRMVMPRGVICDSVS